MHLAGCAACVGIGGVPGPDLAVRITARRSGPRIGGGVDPKAAAQATLDGRCGRPLADDAAPSGLSLAAELAPVGDRSASGAV